MAHSYVMAHDDEIDAFRSYLRAVRLGVGAAHRHLRHRRGGPPGGGGHGRAAGVRGRGACASTRAIWPCWPSEVRAILDDAGYAGVQILASGDLDEHRVAELVGGGRPHRLLRRRHPAGHQRRRPYLGVVYKLVEQDGEPRVKLAPGKRPCPAASRLLALAAIHDLLALDGEAVPAGGRPLLAPVWRGATAVSRPEARLVGGGGERCLDALAERPVRGRVGRPVVGRARAPLQRGRRAWQRWP